MLSEQLSKKSIILGSQSPRRKELLASIGLQFQVRVNSVEEVYPENLPHHEIAEYLAELKGSVFQLNDSEIVITADSIVSLEGRILGKPDGVDGAKEMLKLLSGKVHTVYTGVVIKSVHKKVAFTETTKVTFRNLSDSEIDHYINQFKPLDKAGSYGIQDWIGIIGVERIEGSFFNVMGLPTHRVYTELLKFC